MKHWDVSIQVRKDRIRTTRDLPWVLQSFTVLARTQDQAIVQARIRATMRGLATNEVFMCTPVEAA